MPRSGASAAADQLDVGCDLEDVASAVHGVRPDRLAPLHLGADDHPPLQQASRRGALSGRRRGQGRSIAKAHGSPAEPQTLRVAARPAISGPLAAG